MLTMKLCAHDEGMFDWRNTVQPKTSSSDNPQTQNKSVGCIPHLPSVDMEVVEAYDELMTYDNLSLEFPSWLSKISLGKFYNKLMNS